MVYMNDIYLIIYDIFLGPLIYDQVHLRPFGFVNMTFGQFFELSYMTIRHKSEGCGAEVCVVIDQMLVLRYGFL